MIDRTPPARRLLALLLASVAVVAACGGATSPSPSASAAAVAPTASPSPTPEPSATSQPDPSSEPVPTACLSLGDIDCQRAASLAREVLLESDPPVVYVQVGPFACREGTGCPTTLAARPEGDVTIEFADGTAILVHIKDEAGAVQQTRGDAMGILVDPSSPVGWPAGPQPFTLGHCGIFSGIDVDGSWWDPVGPVDMNGGDAVNATEGVLNLTDPTHGTFTAPSGFAIQLQRRDGAKVLPPCM